MNVLAMSKSPPVFSGKLLILMLLDCAVVSKLSMTDCNFIDNLMFIEQTLC